MGLAGLVGLYGAIVLAAFTTERRVKEIAIRKILGANNGQLCFMLLNQFTFLIVLANVIALPIAYWANKGLVKQLYLSYRPANECLCNWNRHQFGYRLLRHPFNCLQGSYFKTCKCACK